MRFPRSGLIEVLDVGTQDTMKLLLLQDEQVIETLATHAAQKTFTDGIGARSVIGCFQYLDAAGCGHARETVFELGITIKNEILQPSTISSRLPLLLGSPSVGRGTCDADVNHSPRVEFDNEEGEKRTEEKISDWEKVASPDVFGMVLQEGDPGLSSRPGLRTPVDLTPRLLLALRTSSVIPPR